MHGQGHVNVPVLELTAMFEELYVALHVAWSSPHT